MWHSDMANIAFCGTIKLRREILERQQSIGFSSHNSLEPGAAEFIAALAAGTNSHNILQVGCGLSTIALAAAAQVTGGLLVSIHRDREIQGIVCYYIKLLGLSDFVDFLVNEPNDVISTRGDIDFAFFTGDPKEYIGFFDLLNLRSGAIVIADNALNEASNNYIRHVRCQPGVDSSTLPLARGLEVTKILSFDDFKSRRILYSESDFIGQDGTHTGKESMVKEEVLLIEANNSKGVSIDDNDATTVRDSPTKCETTDEVQVEPPAAVTLSQDLGETVTFPEACEDMSNYMLHNTQHPSLFSSAKSVTLHDYGHAEESITKRALASLVPVNKDDAYLLSENRENAASIFNVNFRNSSTDTQVLITGVNWDMLLTDITMAFHEMGISVKMAQICTYDNYIEDIFYVIDAQSKAPIQPSKWDAIRNQILQRISGRRC